MRQEEVVLYQPRLAQMPSPDAQMLRCSDAQMPSHVHLSLSHGSSLCPRSITIRKVVVIGPLISKDLKVYKGLIIALIID